MKLIQKSPVGLLLGLFISCSEPGNIPSEPDFLPLPDAGTTMLEIDCRGDTQACPEFTINGDPPDTSVFRGYADPSVRKDHNSNRIWLAYSWPHVTSAAKVDIHLAHSDDEGKTFVFDKVLYQAKAEMDSKTGKTGFASHEVVSLWPGSDAQWYMARLQYHVEPGKGPYGLADSFTTHVAKASNILDLDKAPETSLHSNMTATQWTRNVNLNQLHGDLTSCGFYNEPAIYFRNGRLVLLLECLVFGMGGVTDEEKSFYAVFSTDPKAANPTQWQWKYDGKLAVHTEAKELGAGFVVELDIAPRPDGSLITLLTPSSYNTSIQHDVHHGCRVLKLTDSDPPSFVRENGKLSMLASITASDLTPYGPGACGYHPASTQTGIVFTRKTQTGPSGGTWSFHRSKLLP